MPMQECGADPNPFRPFLGFGDITQLDNKAGSSYHALQTQLRRSIGALQLNVSYTYSHSIDDASDGGVFGDGGILNAFDFRAFRASSNFDERHLFKVSYVYDLPFFKGSGMANRLIGAGNSPGLPVGRQAHLLVCITVRRILTTLASGME